MLVAEIGSQGFCPQALAQVTKLTDLFAADYPMAPDFTQSLFFIAAAGFLLMSLFLAGACWPDDIKSDGVEMFNNWHFIDNALIPKTPPGTAIPATAGAHTVTWAMNNTIR